MASASLQVKSDGDVASVVKLLQAAVFMHSQLTD